MCITHMLVVVVPFSVNVSISTEPYARDSRWRKAMEMQGRSRSELPYRSRVQPYAAWYSLIACVLMLLINGYTGGYTRRSFVLSFLGVVDVQRSFSIPERILVYIDFYFLIFVCKLPLRSSAMIFFASPL